MMSAWISTRRLIVLALCTVALMGPVWAQQDALSLLPEDCLGCVKINGIDPTLSDVDGFLSGVSPIVPGMLIRGQLMTLLGNPTLNGLDQKGSLVLFALPSQDPAAGMPVTPGLLVPVSNYAGFVQGSHAIAAADDAGVSTITLQGGPTLSMVQVSDRFALVVPSEGVDIQSLKARLGKSGAATVSGRLSSLAKNQTGRHRIWAYVNVTQLNKTFGPMIQMSLASIQQAMQQMPEQPGMAQATKMFAALTGLLDQLDTVTTSVAIAPTALSVHTSMTAGKGSTLAQLLDGKAQPACLTDLQGAMDPAAFMSYVGSFDGAKVGSLLQLFLGQVDEELIKKYGAAGQVCTVGQAVVAHDPSGKPAILATAMAQADRIDPLVELMTQPQQMLKWLNLEELLDTSGVSIETESPKKVFSHQGVDVQGLTQKVVLKDANSAESQMAMMWTPQETPIRWARVDRYVVSATGPGCDDAIKRLIDRAKQGNLSAASSELKSLVGLLEDSRDADFIATYNYAKLADLMKQALPLPIPPTGIPVKTPLVLAGKCRQGTASGELVVPKQHLQELMQFVMAMQMQQMQQQMQNQPGPSPSGPVRR